MSVEEKIIETIQDKGPVSFKTFMEMALYYPDLGYYTSAAEKIGTAGDFYTSPYLSNAFGAIIGKQLEEMWFILQKQPFSIVEYGAGTGILCRDILHYLQRNTELYSSLTYYIIEKSASMRNKEHGVLAGVAEKIKWVSSITEITDLYGCVLSNELVDNLAVHRVLMQDELMEIFVDYNGQFVEVLQPASTDLKNYLERFNIVLSKGFKTEINLEAENWITAVATALKKGFVLTIDYGYTAAELYQEQRQAGTLVCYHKHTINEDPFKNVGRQDITTHVNFSSLAEAGTRAGLNYCGFTTQSNFLLSLGLVNYIRELEQAAANPAAMPSATDRSMFALLFEMGRKLKVLIQSKDAGRPFLSGIRFPMQI